MGTSLSFIRIACGFESSYTLYVLHVLANFKHLSMTQLLVDKRAFIAAIADDNGYGWAVAKSLAATGVEVLIDGLLMEISKVYPLDAVYDNPEDVPKNVKNNKRHACPKKWTVQKIADSVKRHFGSIDTLVHSLVNGPKVQLLAFLSFLCCYFEFAMHLNCGASISLTYMGSESFIPGCGGAMPKAIGFIDMMIYSLENASLQKEMTRTEALYLHLVVYRNNILTYNGTEDVGNAAAFLASSLASAITGAVIYVHNGLDAMGDGAESLTF
ncbi:Enoyl-(acyl-carrier-protein) reductase (NADH) [Citrus sinensis]|nr:Enoyl-(acyl-carrier-protein) reductase (NADH) [Citrus sinensis]